MSFSDHLRQFGPGSTVRVSRDDALAYCARLTATHYENFSVVTWLTPREHRPAFQSIYAFCRWSDDLGDEAGDPAISLELLSWWRTELRAMYEGEARHPVMIALAETVRRHDIPERPFQALISAFEQDQRITEYLTYEQLLDYCARSANPVGHLVLYVAGAFSPENARLADMTCSALQLANFWQDVARDLAIGRIYLPREDRARFDYPESDLRPCDSRRRSLSCCGLRSRGLAISCSRVEPWYRESRRTGRRRRLVFPRRFRHPRSDRGARFRRAQSPTGLDALDQASLIGPGDHVDGDGPVRRPSSRDGGDRHSAE